MPTANTIYQRAIKIAYNIPCIELAVIHPNSIDATYQRGSQYQLHPKYQLPPPLPNPNYFLVLEGMFDKALSLHCSIYVQIGTGASIGADSAMKIECMGL